MTRTGRQSNLRLDLFYVKNEMAPNIGDDDDCYSSLRHSVTQGPFRTFPSPCPRTCFHLGAPLHCPPSSPRLPNEPRPVVQERLTPKGVGPKRLLEPFGVTVNVVGHGVQTSLSTDPNLTSRRNTVTNTGTILLKFRNLEFKEYSKLLPLLRGRHREGPSI